MSVKLFHLLFLCLTGLMLTWFEHWGDHLLHNDHISQAIAALSGLGTVALLCYAGWFVGKTRNVG